jgi:hypothetical protein
MSLPGSLPGLFPLVAVAPPRTPRVAGGAGAGGQQHRQPGRGKAQGSVENATLEVEAHGALAGRRASGT